MAADYPDGVNTAGPYISRLQETPVNYPIDKTLFEDGGADINVQVCGLKKFTLEYEGLTAAEVTTLRNHHTDARGQTEEFLFYHRRDDAFYTVRYESFKLPRRVRTWSNPVTVVLVMFA